MPNLRNKGTGCDGRPSRYIWASCSTLKSKLLRLIDLLQMCKEQHAKPFGINRVRRKRWHRMGPSCLCRDLRVSFYIVDVRKRYLGVKGAETP